MNKDIWFSFKNVVGGSFFKPLTKVTLVQREKEINNPYNIEGGSQ